MVSRHRARFRAVAFLSTVLVGQHTYAGLTSSQTSTSLDHVSWVAESLKRIQTVKPGMTRADLLKVFTTEGGIWQRTGRTYVSLDCPYFKVDVRFQVVGEPGLIENSQDIVTQISRPYLQFMVLD